MGNLYGKFSIKYLNFNGWTDKETIMGGYNSDFICLNENVPQKELKKVFDDFYGGSILENDGNIYFSDIPVRLLCFETGGTSEIIAIGHVQEDLWVSKEYSEVVTEDMVVKKHVETYLKKIMDDFPHFINKFLHIFQNNSYEMCDMLDFKDTNPLDFSKIFQKIFLKISESTK